MIQSSNQQNRLSNQLLKTILKFYKAISFNYISNMYHTWKSSLNKNEWKNNKIINLELYSSKMKKEKLNKKFKVLTLTIRYHLYLVKILNERESNFIRNESESKWKKEKKKRKVFLGWLANIRLHEIQK